MHTRVVTCIHHPSPPQWARPAGGDLPLLRGFPGCLINYPSAIVYQEAEVERRKEKPQNGHCQVEGSISLPAWGWGLERREGEPKDQSYEVCSERKQEHDSPAAGMMWHYTDSTSFTTLAVLKRWQFSLNDLWSLTKHALLSLEVAHFPLVSCISQESHVETSMYGCMYVWCFVPAEILAIFSVEKLEGGYAL